MTDLKAAAGAAKATADVFNALPPSAYFGPEWHAHNDARRALREALGNDYDVILALYAERDGAFLTSQQAAQSYSNLMRVKDDIDAQRQAAEASLASATKEVERLRAALETLEGKASAVCAAEARKSPLGYFITEMGKAVIAARYALGVLKTPEALTKETPNAG